MECPVHLEATLRAVHPIGEEDEQLRGRLIALEVHIERVHVEEGVLSSEKPDHIDPDKWSPLIMSFQQFYGLGRRLQASRLAGIPESNYRMTATVTAPPVPESTLPS